MICNHVDNHLCNFCLQTQNIENYDLPLFNFIKIFKLFTSAVYMSYKRVTVIY